MIPDQRLDDLEIKDAWAGGFAMVELKDMDDGDVIILNENQILGLHRFLTNVIEHYKLDTE